MHKRRYCPTQEAEKPGEFVHDRRDRQDVDVNPMGSDSEEELNAPWGPRELRLRGLQEHLVQETSYVA